MNIFTLNRGSDRYNKYNYRKRNPDIKHFDPNAIFQSLQSPFIVVAADYPKLTIVDENNAHAQLTMADHLENIGKPLLEAFPDTSEKYKKSGKSEVAESIQRAILTGSPDAMPDVRFDLKDKNGTWNERYWSLVHYPVFQDGVVVGAYQEAKDITHERKVGKELEQELLHEKQKLELRVEERTRQLQLTNEGLRDEIAKRETAERKLYDHSKELTRSNEELENFAYVASHDLQEPLRKIQSFGDLLLSEYGDSLGIEGADYLTRMHSAANRMSSLIGDLLDFSRVARKTHPKRDVDLNIVVSEVLGDLETRIVETNATVKMGKLPVICADPTHMRQLFQNLIGNALKFHKPGQPPMVTVRSRTKSNGVEITVSDNGVGFDEKYLDRIFSVFQRLHERTKYEGTGIGLAICRKIVEYYGGTITASSIKGEGATFSVWLPIKIRKK